MSHVTVSQLAASQLDEESADSDNKTDILLLPSFLTPTSTHCTQDLLVMAAYKVETPTKNTPEETLDENEEIKGKR